MRGEELLKLEAAKEEPAYSYLKNVRKAGAEDEDIVWYWNMPDKQHKQLKLENAAFLMSVFSAKKEEGLSAAEAADFLKYSFPRFESFDTLTEEKMRDFLPDELLRYKTNFFRFKKWRKYRKAHPEIATMNECLRQMLANR